VGLRERRGNGGRQCSGVGDRACMLLLFLLCVAVSASAADLNERQDKSAAVDVAKSFYQQRKFGQAIDVLERVISANPGDREAAQILALSYYSIGKLDQTILLLDRLQSDFGSAGLDTAYLLGMCYLKTTQPDKARAAFARMYSVQPGSAVAHLLFARMLVREHQEEGAVPELKTAISLDGRLGMAHFLLGEIYLHKGAAESAIAEFRKELEISPALWLVYWRLGDALANTEAYDEAERTLKQAIWLNESFSGPYVTLGQIALKRRDFKLAAGLLERAVKMEPNNQNAHYSLAKTYQKLGRTDDANRQFEMSRSLLTEKNSSQSLIDVPR
jgi:tetratricopeptide (TPR) repeat protein